LVSAVISNLGLGVSSWRVHPRYRGANAVTSDGTAKVFVEPMQDRLSYEMCGANYRPKMALSQTSQGDALQDNAAVTRYNDIFRVGDVLTELKG